MQVLEPLVFRLASRVQVLAPFIAMKTDVMSLTAPPKPTWQTVPFKLLLGCVTVAPLLVISYTWLAERALSPEYAKLFLAPLYAIWGTVGSAAGVGTVWRAVRHSIAGFDTQQQLVLQQATSAPFVDVDGDGLPDDDGTPSE